MNKIVIILGLLLLGNEVLSMAVICVLCFWGLTRLLNEAARGGFFT